MTQRIIGPTGSRRRRRFLLIAPFALLAALLLAIGASAGTIGVNAGFEDDDGNLVDNTGTGINAGIDWNTFAPISWSTGTAPYRQAEKVGTSGALNGWQFKGLEDAAVSGTDSAFGGGTKQDADCASVGSGPKPPNKDDLKRAYVASKTGTDGHTYLMLAWARIPQNTTSASAHVGFEFNKGTSGACPAASDGLVKRTAGDLLVVYDFEGGDTDIPTITVRKWITTGACEISSDNAPCWGPAQNLTQAGFAEAKVFVSQTPTGTVTDDLTPPAPPATTSISGTLADREFGEAGIDLTAANIFTAGTCNSFGKVYAVSRSSGDSGQAAMKDLVGPGNFTLSNCGRIKIIKHTSPADLNQNFSYTSNIAGADLTCTLDTTPASFTLNDSGAGDTTGNTEDCTNVPAGSYTVTEGADPAGFSFGSLSCTPTSGTSFGAQDGTVPKQANITLAGGGVVTCTYVNNQQLGAIKITKTSSKGTNPGLNGATFSITKGGTAITGSPFTTATVNSVAGVICVSNLAFGDYVVTETGAPTGYAKDDATGHTVTVDNNASCSDTTYVGESIGFTDTPLSDIEVLFRDGGSGATSATITCDNGTGTTTTPSVTGWDTTKLVTGVHAPSVIHCTIDIDP
jgi:hypothetical protein